MANISLNASNLLDAANKMEDAANRVDEALKRLDAIMSDLDAVWSDKNSKLYLAKYEELKEEHFPKFRDAAHNYSAFLKAVVETYKREFIDEVSQDVQ